jgi:hypothetical protein
MVWPFFFLNDEIHASHADEPLPVLKLHYHNPKREVLRKVFQPASFEIAVTYRKRSVMGIFLLLFFLQCLLHECYAYHCGLV